MARLDKLLQQVGVDSAQSIARTIMTIRWWCTYPQNDCNEDSLLQAHIQLDESESRREEVSLV